MKGLVNCNFLPGSARRLELGTVSAEPLSRAYWSQELRPLGETVGLSRARTSGESPDSTQAGRGPQWPIQLAAISAHPAAMVGTGMPKLRARTGNEAIAMPTAPSLERGAADPWKLGARSLPEQQPPPARAPRGPFLIESAILSFPSSPMAQDDRWLRADRPSLTRLPNAYRHRKIPADPSSPPRIKISRIRVA